MSTAPAPAPSALARRLQYGLKVGVIALAMTAAAVFAGLLTSRAGVRLDVTATREHRLSPRTESLLTTLDRPYDIIIAAPRRGADPRAWQRLADVLDAMQRRSPNVRFAVIDTGSADGTRQFATLLDDLAVRARPSIDAAVAQVAAAAERADAASAALKSITGAMVAAGDAPGVSPALRESFQNAARGLAGTADQLAAAAKQAKTDLASPSTALPVPATDAIGVALRTPLEQAANSLTALIGDFRALAADPKAPASLKDHLAALQEQSGAARDAAARVGAALAGVKHPAVLAVARSVQRSAAALVIAQPGPDGSPPPERFVTAIAVDRLLPARRPDATAPAPDTRFLAEELLAAGIDALQTRSRPIVVFVHAAPFSIAPQFRRLQAIVERLALAGIDAADWSTARSAEPPALTDLNPDGSRPVVYVTISAPANTAEEATRMAKLADATSRLIARGERVLLSVAPSPLRAVGAPDPMVSFLEPLGLVADSGRPLLREFSGPQRLVVSDEMLINDPFAGGGVDHPVARAILALPTLLVWPIPLTLDRAKAAAATPPPTLAPIITVPADPALWAESQWQDFRERPSSVTSPPAKDSPADLVGGPWTVAASIERPAPAPAADTKSAPATQRIIVVGSNGWFSDDVAAATVGLVDGRVALAAPGNMELFIACVQWLCHQDDRIASGPASQAVATIPPLDPGTLALIRWALIAGIPVALLALAVAWRMIRG
jgi:hypothetical protein